MALFLKKKEFSQSLFATKIDKLQSSIIKITRKIWIVYESGSLSRNTLTLFGMGFFMYIKGIGGGKITPQSKTFKNDAKKLKVSHKLETLRNFPKYQKKKIVAINIF